MTKGNDSGIPATARAAAMIKVSRTGAPRETSTMKMMAQAASTTMASCLASSWNFVFIGGSSGFFWTSPEILPNSVSAPVPVTAAMQLP